jgi:hypothetical protein
MNPPGRQRKDGRGDVSGVKESCGQQLKRSVLVQALEHRLDLAVEPRGRLPPGQVLHQGPAGGSPTLLQHFEGSQDRHLFGGETGALEQSLDRPPSVQRGPRLQGALERLGGRIALVGRLTRGKPGEKIPSGLPRSREVQVSLPERSICKEGKVMFLRMGRLLGSLILMSALFQLIVVVAANTWAAPAPSLFFNPGHTRPYRFTARIKSNGGITPLKVGSLVTGRFTYDLEGKAVRTDGRSWGHYDSARNSFAFQVGDLQFVGVGDVTATVSTFDHSEHFGIVAPDLKLPKGWEIDHTGRSQTYSVLLQNVPPRKVIGRLGIPDCVRLRDFVNTRELRLDFFHGVRFPGGRVDDRAVVYAHLENLQPVGR